MFIVISVLEGEKKGSEECVLVLVNAVYSSRDGVVIANHIQPHHASLTCEKTSKMINMNVNNKPVCC